MKIQSKLKNVLVFSLGLFAHMTFGHEVAVD